LRAQVATREADPLVESCRTDEDLGDKMNKSTYVSHDRRDTVRTGGTVDAATEARLIRDYGFRGAAFFLHGTGDLAA
jgi:hypothetical protein